ncbi:MAG TPA: PorP/SprF family type IX secretion system membrane protein [Bacteroidales bacterium]|nr:PorP/SprF family type IX secretion system membrane protein [Bacteroidales bacterium]HOM41065.1 PorP/SprF family type IX secretion system membrane protein [Bacteroidales bacterium]HRR16091.1 PorP/SprF family type IX secretion system membrane protein [Bacteroidales bacterium]HRT47514.1 PorP/SprF family type IX secretion system membrane protein [Bacteroidales bacterium]HRU56688.1 PorP/SprF family type IX secretion system membrane protein [Bacteroidales bacterium]
MKKNRILILLAVCFASFTAKPQDNFHGYGFQSIVTLNPAAAGSEGDGTLRMMYIMHYPERNMDLHFLSVSYDTYIPLFHGGIAGFVTDNYLGGVLNNLSGGFSYSYHLQAGRNLFVNAGLSAAFRHRGINASKVILPDQIDPLRGPVLPSGESINNRGRTIFDVGTGFMIMWGDFTSGVSVNHLSKPDIGWNGASEDQLPWHITLFAMKVFNLSRKNELSLQPVFLFDFCGDELNVASGATLGNEKFAVSSLLSYSGNGDINLQPGFSLRFSGSLLFYNYCFNLTSENGMLPFTMYHQAGLSLSLNNVDKRKVIKAIKFPNL